MNPNDAVDLTIRNCRPSWLTGPLVVFGLGCLWAAAFGVRVSRVLDWLVSPDIGLCTLGIVTCGVLTLACVYQGVRHWKLGEALVVFPGRRYLPVDIREIAFGPDPAEDYDDTATPARLCEAHARLRRGKLRLVVSVGDARRVRAWGVRHGIAVSDPAGVLVGLRPRDRI